MRQPPAWALRPVAVIDALSRITGLAAIWLVLLCALVSALNAVIRYSSGGILWLEATTHLGVFGAFYRLYAENSNALSDTTWYMFAATVMLPLSATVTKVRRRAVSRFRIIPALYSLMLGISNIRFTDARAAF